MDKALTKIKVLIAEDDFLIAEEISRIIKKLGYQIIGVASNGVKAVEIALKLKPDVVMMDIIMPKLDGLEAAKQIVNGCSAAIIILTAHESHDLIEKAGEFGIAAYLTKPPKAEEIERAVYIALARHRDLAESRRLIKELEDHKQQLKALNATKDKFFSIIAHDLRNPVSALFNFSEYLETNLNTISNEDLPQYLSIIRTTAKGLFGLLDELLLWANLQSNHYEFKPTTLHVSTETNAVINLLLANAARKKIQLEVNIDSETQVFADPNMLHTILRNLVTNAIKFTPSNGSVKINSKINSHEVYITVDDTGIGIAKENMEKLFRIDKQASTLGTEGETGTGLGLVLCKEMVERNNGKIWVESNPGEGSCFTFALPKEPYKN
jgi:two-component system, sensor histidine kinase and response regulator